LRFALLILIVWPVGAWCLYLPFRSLKRGPIRYRQETYERNQDPIMFWLYTIATGLCGAFLLIVSAYFFLNY
jgi:hypothetical protein